MITRLRHRPAGQASPASAGWGPFICIRGLVSELAYLSPSWPSG